MHRMISFNYRFSRIFSRYRLFHTKAFKLNGNHTKMTKDNSSKELLSLYFFVQSLFCSKRDCESPLDNKRCYECCS